MKPPSVKRIALGALQTLIVSGLLIVHTGLKAQVLANPSLEGNTGSIPPPSWANCGGSPDTQILNGSGAGIFGINTPPNDGNTYVGFVSTNYNYIEAIGQSVNLQAGTAYSGSLALFRSVLHSSWNGTGQCQIWGGTSCTNRVELLWTSGTVSNLNNWQTYPVNFAPTMNHSYIVFVNAFNNGTGNADYFCLDNIILNATVLPVEMRTFTATDQNAGVLLGWETEQLSSDCTFEVEWSVDAFDFKKVGHLSAAPGQAEFQLFHDSPQPGQNYYRLRMIDVNGDENFSQIRRMEHEKNHFVNVFPNPANARINLGMRIYEDAEVQVRLLDADGRVVFAGRQDLPQGSPVMTLDLGEGLAAGLYHLEIRMGDAVSYRNVTLQK